jgi:ABC-type multidrug transport system fused ATPase/permease subunit
MFKWQLLASGFVKAVSDVLQFASPFLLKKLLEFVSNPNAHLWQGIALAILMFVASEVRSLCINWYFYVSSRIQIYLNNFNYLRSCSALEQKSRLR